MDFKRQLFQGGPVIERPSQQEAQEAVKTLIRWAGDNPEREGLLQTPERFLQSFREYCSGYETDPIEFLQNTFSELSGYGEMVILRDIPFHSMCEHHLSPMVGVAHIAYIPQGRVVDISKLVHVVDVLAKRLQIQEKATAEIARTIDQVLEPLGVLVVIEAIHHCLNYRGAHKGGSTLITEFSTGRFKNDRELCQEMLEKIRLNKR